MDKLLSILCVTLMMPTAASGKKLLPDLVPDPVITFNTMYIEHRSLPDMRCALEEGCASSSAFKLVVNSTEWYSHKRVLLKFATATWNFGSMDFNNPLDPSEWIWHSCHKHYHSIEHFASYDILDSQGNMVGEGHKASFCLRDNSCLYGYERNYTCKGKQYQGISVGCKDVYDRGTDCQWIDLTDVAPGNYTFQTHINPGRYVPELNYDNNIVNCDISFDGQNLTVGSCTLGGVQVGHSCTNTGDCSYPNAKCKRSVCGCKPGYRTYDVKGFHKGCIPDCDPNEKLRCKNGGTVTCPVCLECQSTAPHRCECPEGFTGVHCEKTSTGTGESPCPKKINKKWKATIKVGKETCENCKCKQLVKMTKLFTKACKKNLEGARDACCKMCEQL